MSVIARQKMHAVDVARAFLSAAEIARSPNAVKEFFAHLRDGSAGVIVKHGRQVRRAINGCRF